MADAGHQEQQVSSIGVKWARKMAIIFLLVVGIGTWALYDATIKYPAKGRQFVEWAEWQYLILLDEESNAQRDPGIITRNAAVTDPKAELIRLRSDPNAGARPSMQARFEWLQALSHVGMLEPENTDFDQVAPRQRLAELQQKWASTSKPAPLHGYDLPLQWVILVVGYGLGLYLLYLVLRVAATKYRWDPARKALTLPGGETITPTDLEEVDKRKWDKFIVFLKMKPDAANLPGKSVRVDTYRHSRVEEWILEMETEAFGSQEPAAASEPVREPEPADEKG